MVQDEFVVFRDGQTLIAEGGVGLEVKGGSKGSGMVFGYCPGRIVAVMVWDGSYGLLFGAVFVGGLSRRRRLRWETVITF